MKDSRILSAFQELPHAQGALPLSQMPELKRNKPYLFDTCQVGVVLRAVVFVQAIVLVGSLFETSGFMPWLALTMLLTGASQPAVVMWLLVVCLFKKPLDRLQVEWQWSVAIVLGALSGLYGCSMLWMLGLLERAPWLASAASGALVSAVMVAALVWRDRARMPAGTTARLTELQARIRPHFLFNTLNLSLIHI